MSETEVTDKNRYLSLIPEPLPNAMRYRLAEKEREIGINTTGSQEQLDRILNQFKDIKTGKVRKVNRVRQVEVPIEEDDNDTEGQEKDGEGNEEDNEKRPKTKIIEEHYEEEVPEEQDDQESGHDDEEVDPLDEILDVKYFRKLLKHITPEGVCPTDVLNTSIAQIEDSLELLKQISLLFKMKIPKIDVEAMADMPDEKIQALDIASTVMNTSYPTVGIETETGVSTAESRQAMKIQSIPREGSLSNSQTTGGMGGMAVVAGNQQISNMPGMAMVVADDTPQGQLGSDPNGASPSAAASYEASLPPYMRTQKVNPYANAYGGLSPTVSGAPIQNMSPFNAPKSVYDADAYASIAYKAPEIQAPVPQPQQPAQSIPSPIIVPTAPPKTFSPALLSSFDAFDILSRIVARAIALFLKRAAIVDTRLLVTFGGREAKDLAVSLGSADEDVSIVKTKFERQRKIIETRQEDELKCIKNMFEDFKKKFKENLPTEKKLIAARFELLRRAYNDKRCNVAKKSADLLMATMLGFFPRYSVLGNRWIIVPSVPRSYPSFTAYDMLRDKMCSVHPVITPNLDRRLLFGIANVEGVIRPSGITKSDDAFKKVYIITPQPPEFTLRELLDKMPRALHPREVAHLLFPLVCTLARLQALPGESTVIIHRDIRPSTVFLTPYSGTTMDEFVGSPYPIYDPNAPTYDNGNVLAKRLPIPKVPVPSIFHLGVVRNCVMDEPIELNTMYCAPEVVLGGMCECTDTWSIGLLCIKLLLPPLGGGAVTRMTRVAVPSGPLTPVNGGIVSCGPAIAGYLNDVARLSGVYDRINAPLVDDLARSCRLPAYGVQLVKTSLPMHETSVSMSVDPMNMPSMNTYSGINAFVQPGNITESMTNALEGLLPGCDMGTIQFIKDCLSFNPRERPSPIKLAHHPWFREHGLRVQ